MEKGFEIKVLEQTLHEGDIIRIKQKPGLFRNDELLGWVKHPARTLLSKNDFDMIIIPGVVVESIKIKNITELEILKKFGSLELVELLTMDKSWFEKNLENHPKTEDCNISECILCGYRDCPNHEPLHYHHDGCPSCFDDEIKEEEEKDDDTS